MNKLFNKELKAVGSSGSAGAAPRMTGDSCEQCGRSLVEMLGTLAIMGILGVAGVAAYNNAMNSHRANEVVHSVSKMAVSAAGQFLMRDSFSLNEFNNKTDNGYTASELNYGKEPIFGIRVEGLPKEICQKIVAMHWTKPKEIAINGNPNTACVDNATMDFIFSKNLEADDYEVERCTKDADCFSACDKCMDGVCQESCDEGKVCGQNVNNSTKKVCCLKSNYLDGYCCNKIENGNCINNNNVGCPVGYFWGQEETNDPACYSCDDEGNFKHANSALLKASCQACPNRDARRYSCSLPCNPGYIKDYAGLCYSCSSASSINISAIDLTRSQAYESCITNCTDYNPNRKIGCFRTMWNGGGCFCYSNGCPTGSSDAEQEGVCLSEKGYYYDYHDGGKFLKCPTNPSNITGWMYDCSDECHLVWDNTTKTCSFPADITVMDYQWGCEAAGGTWSEISGTCTPKS